MKPSERFHKFLKKQNLRLTSERRQVVEEVFTQPGHFTVSELLDRMKKKRSSLGRSTLYRVIPLLVQAGMIFEVAVSGGREEQVYENSMGPRHHDHLICDSCGAVVEFEDKDFHALLENTVHKYGYRLRGHVLHLRGLCPECQENIIAGELSAW